MTRETRRGLVVAGLMSGMFLAGLDALVVGAAMPTIVRELGGLELYSWAFTAYMLAASILMPFYGKAADAIGPKVTFVAGILAFLVGSVICALAPTMLAFVAGRAVQGIGAAALFTLPFALLATLYPPQSRAKALGFMSAVWAVSSILGPVLGAFIIEIASWPWVFWINLPVGALAIALVALNLHEESAEAREPRGRRLDVVGALVLMVATGMLLVGLDRGLALVALASAPLFLVLARVESRAENPILPVGILRDARVAAAVAAGFLAHFAVFGAIAFAPLVVQRVGDGGAAAAGLTLLPLSIMWSGTSLVGGRFVHKHGERPFVIAGMTTLLVGLVAAFFLVPRGLPWALPPMAFIGLGMGLQTPALLTSVQNLVPAKSLGAATATLQFMRNLGSTVGIAAWGLAVLGGAGGALVESGVAPVGAPDLAFPAGVLVGLIGALAGLAVSFRIPADTLAPVAGEGAAAGGA